MPVNGVNNSKVSGGLCPHGLAPGACPICSGMGGGGSKKNETKTTNPGEWTWGQCAAYARMMRNQKMAKEMFVQTNENRLIAMAKFEANMMNVSHKLALMSVAILNSMPPLIAKPVALIINKAILPVLNFIKNLPVNILKAMDNIKQKMLDIQDKLNAVFGELKNAVEKKISDSASALKKKLISLFAIYETTDTDDDEKKIEEDKRTFEVKTFIHDIYNKITQTTQAYGQLKKDEKEKINADK